MDDIIGKHSARAGAQRTLRTKQKHVNKFEKTKMTKSQQRAN